MSLRYGSVCSGIESATVAWHPLGWQPQFFSEIDTGARAVLQHRWPEVPLHGDFTTIQAGDYGPIDLLVGGTPCQDFSVAGLRGGLAGERGNLSLEFLRLAQRLGPRWVVWENVPGVLSSGGGRDFGAILGGLVELGYGFAYRVLDAQYIRVDGFGRAVPQRRRRVFVVGHLGDWRRAAAVLFERACLRGDLAPRREAGAGLAEHAGLSAAISSGQGWWDSSDVGATIRAQDSVTKADTLVAHSLRGEGSDASEDGTGRGTPIVPVAFGGNDTRGPIQVATAVNAHGGPCGRMDFERETFIAFDTTQITSAANRSAPHPGDPCHPLAAGAHPPAIAFNSRQDPDVTWDRAGSLSSSSPQAEAIAFQERGREGGRSLEIGGDVAFALTAPAGGGRSQERNVAIGHNNGPALWAVRRLTPLECERLQGFPDGYTRVPTKSGAGWAADGPRYKQLGNSKAVNAVRWLGRRIAMVEALTPPSQPGL